jgi:isopenicillin N synthase-like dioxygenase
MEQTLLGSIPSLDLADFNSVDSAKKNKFVQDLGNAFNTIGFVALKNHGLSDELREKL